MVRDGWRDGPRPVKAQGIEGMKGTLPLDHRVTRPLAAALNWRPRWTVGCPLDGAWREPRQAPGLADGGGVDRLERVPE